MKNTIIKLMALIAAIGTLFAFTSSVYAKAPGSFLPKTPASSSELASLVEKNTALASRYAAHFGIPKNSVASYFKNLKLTKTTERMSVQIWYINKYNKVAIKSKTLAKGTAVFTTADGKPVLLKVCGNPLCSTLPQIKKVVKTKPSVETITKKRSN